MGHNQLYNINIRFRFLSFSEKSICRSERQMHLQCLQQNHLHATNGQYFLVCSFCSHWFPFNFATICCAMKKFRKLFCNEMNLFCEFQISCPLSRVFFTSQSEAFERLIEKQNSKVICNSDDDGILAPVTIFTNGRYTEAMCGFC